MTGLRRGWLLVAGCSWVLVLIACSRDTISRPEWQQLPREDRALYVQSLLGEEKAKDAKGGRGSTYLLTAEDYVAQIDQAYAGGDTRAVREVFASLAK